MTGEVFLTAAITKIIRVRKRNLYPNPQNDAQLGWNAGVDVMAMEAIDALRTVVKENNIPAPQQGSER